MVMYMHFNCSLLACAQMYVYIIYMYIHCISIPMEDCFSCKVISTGAFFASSAYLVYGAKYWPEKQNKSAKKFLYAFSAGKHVNLY